MQVVDLHRRDAEVEQDRVGLDALVDEALELFGERADAQLAVEPGVALGKRCVEPPHGAITVDRDVASMAFHRLGEELGVAAGAERSIDDGHARFDVQPGNDLALQDRDVRAVSDGIP